LAYNLSIFSNYKFKRKMIDEAQNIEEVKEQKKKKYTVIIIIWVVVIAFLTGLFTMGYFMFEISQNRSNTNNENYTEESQNTNLQDTSIENPSDSLLKTKEIKELTMSAPEGMEVEYSIDNNAGIIYKKVYTGRRINIAVTGIDSRAGERYKHADANHIISILPDNGEIEIIAIPRDTEADAGFDDTTGQNKLTVVLAARGRSGYLKEMARIGEIDKIHYYVEFGFSQALGIFSWLGFNDPNSTLKVLRSRKYLGGDDYQRAYNQAQFMRQMILKHFHRLNGTFGSIFLRGGLTFVETNLSFEEADKIINDLKTNNFGDSGEDVIVKVRPAMGIKFKVYDFTADESIQGLSRQIDSKHEKSGDSITMNAESIIKRRLDNVLQKAIADSANRPRNVSNSLQVYFNQKIWYQFKDKDKQNHYRKEIANLLIHSYGKQKKYNEMEKIKGSYEKEILLFQNRISNDSTNIGK